MQILYVYHSCFVIDFDNCTLVIDFYKESDKKERSANLEDYLCNKSKPLYVLCTHSHHDHFNPEIFTWKEQNPTIKYIFSKELKESGTTSFEDAIYLGKYEIYSDEYLSVQAFGSTDIGGSFWISCCGKTVFHSGDLNNWHWIEESTAEESQGYENDFLAELDIIAKYAKSFDVAMFPVDPRLGKEYMRGAEQFITRFQCGYFLPMHFDRSYVKANAFKLFAETHGAKFISLTHQGQLFTI